MGECDGHSHTDSFEFLDPLDQVIQFIIRDLDFPFDCVDLVQQLLDPHEHQVNDELLDNNHATE
jgi:hypothetical protein